MIAARIRAAAARLWALPPFLLVAVATAQIVAAKTTSISPWLGGGFGMFATTDSWSRRHLHAVALRPGLREELDIPSYLRDDVRRALALPNERHLSLLAHELAILDAEEGDPNAGPLEAISIRVFRLHFDRDTLAPSGEPIASFELPVEE